MDRGFTIGVAGHVDHGKTTLVRTLTGIDTDRKKEEKARGLSIESGVAPLTLPNGLTVSMVDVPGHTDFLKNTIRGLNGVDMAMLAVAADDGVMPQTREHVEILAFFQATAAMVVITKADLVDEETLELAELELREMLGGTFFDDCPIYKFTHQEPELCKGITAGIETELARITGPKTQGPFRMWIDQIRSVRGHGTVVSGTVAAGAVTCGDEVQLLPSGIKTRVRSMESHGRTIDSATAGHRVGINLHRIPLTEVGRGMSLGSAGAIVPTYLINAEMQVIGAQSRGIKNRQRVKVYLGTSVTSALIVLMDGEVLRPGSSGLVQIRLRHTVTTLPQDTFVVSPMNENTVIAGGRVLEIPREKYRTVKHSAVVPMLSALQKADAEAYIEHLFRNCSGRLVSALLLSQITGLPKNPFERIITAKVQKGEWIYIKGHGATKKEHFTSVQEQFKFSVLEAFRRDPLKQKIGLSEVTTLMGWPVDDALLNMAADELCSRGEILRKKGGYLPAQGKPALSAAQNRKADFILDYIDAAGLTPIGAGFFWKQHKAQFGRSQVDRMFDYLYRRKKLVRLSNNRFLSEKAFEEIRVRVSTAIQKQGYVTLGDCNTLLGYGRSVGAHVFDHLNAVGVTVRVGDRHYLKEECPG